MSKTLQLYFALLLWWVVPAEAQLTLSFPNIVADPDEQVDVDLTVENYSQIINIQFTMRWDPEIVEFVEMTDTNFMDKSSLFVNEGNAPLGFIQLLWTDFTLGGESLDDGDALVKMKFKVIGDKGDTSWLEISDDPVMFLAGDSVTQAAIPTARNNGTVIVRKPVSTYGPVSEGNLTLHQNQPNPFREETRIQFDLTESEYITFKLYDLSGKLILEQAQLYPAGSQFIVLEQHQLPSAGTYLYQIQSENYLLTKKMNLVR